MRRALAAAALLVAIVAGLAGAVVWQNQGDLGDEPPASTEPLAQRIARGEQLALAGNCMACHTEPGGAPWAGGRAIDTPFGTVHSSNLTPDAATGLGAWTARDFWRAMHHGRSRDGRLLYPAFPYPNTTIVSRDDADAMFAYLRTLAPVAKANRAHALRFPYDTQTALAVWRALYFRPASFVPDAAQSAEWNRGAYLVQGLGHCNACHASRNALGATPGPLDLGGGMIPMQNWYAPSLTSPHEAGVAGWETADVVALLKTGVAPGASVAGPMAEVVARSTQYLGDADLTAMAVYLKSLPQTGSPRQAAAGEASPAGAQLYERHCSDCHGAAGEGAARAYPALTGNRAVQIDPPANLVRIVVGGGFAPATAGNPRPYGMPPFATVLSDAEIAAVLTHIRGTWGNTAPAVSVQEVARYRGRTAAP